MLPPPPSLLLLLLLLLLLNLRLCLIFVVFSLIQ
jgi:hypothetical protein